MVYKVLGLMSGSSADGLDIIFVELDENRGNWSYIIKAGDCIFYDKEWREKLITAKALDAYNYMLLHIAYAKFIAVSINNFISKNNLQHQVQLIATHGHTVFHAPENNMTAQLGDGATIAALTGINVVSDLRNMDVALNGQGAPIVPLGEKLIFYGYNFYLNIGGIANVSFQSEKNFIAFDVCAANSILNRLANLYDNDFDEDGKSAATGTINQHLLNNLNALDYYKQSFPKSLSNNFTTDVVYPLIQSFQLQPNDALRTYVEHIAFQIQQSVKQLIKDQPQANYKMLVTGGGALNIFLIEVLKPMLAAINVEIIIPETNIIKFKEALIMALLGVLRWREENTVLASVTGASRNSIGGAVWIGQEA